MASNYGKQFEKNIETSCKKQNILFERYKDNGKFGFGNQTRFSSKNPCDGHIFYKSNLFYVELKSSKTGSISFNQPPDIKKENAVPSIKPHQVKALIERSVYSNVYSGLIVWFPMKSINNINCFYIDINIFYEWTKTCNKKSMNIKDANKIGIPISSRKLKVNYVYDIENVLNNILEGQNNGNK